MMFKKTTLAVFFMLPIISAYAVDGSVNFTGEIVDAACKVDVGASSALSVDLGKVQKSALTGDGSTASATKFTLKLSSCPSTITKAAVKFAGTPYDNDDSILALTSGTGVATGVGIQLLDAGNAVLPLFTDSTSYTLVADDENDLDFYARYIQKGTTVVAGKANATASFTIDYQ
ncbi:major type 1 subunit fimbrin (pilin) [Enterobacter asburiae]|jgi:major type 1 subunit fimbrin (pilin)|uniref:fimbrial protein n=1 Tax=Enterobacter TaxID=547 RepID=UPI000516CE83|nr:fimbrial protein [Enterobacter asburiae]ELP5717212.1 fimbrial protein [Enterobacter asburiae]EMA4738252.1 fimbrial protein [Enterobacter asburiae]EMA4739931.1 fimbrial protein [Enterobacter asburiae]NIH88737.1 major type 1 subunit fimbrin (pilin) [Enterobacter asburiae]